LRSWRGRFSLADWGMTQLFPLPGYRLVRVVRDGPPPSPSSPKRSPTTPAARRAEQSARRSIAGIGDGLPICRPAVRPSGCSWRFGASTAATQPAPAEPSPDGSRSCSPAMPNAPAGWPGAGPDRSHTRRTVSCPVARTPGHAVQRHDSAADDPGSAAAEGASTLCRRRR
jgi:hypothetical protein